MTENKKTALKNEKVGGTMYINFEVLDKLENLEINLGFTKLTKNSDKIAYLIDFFQKNS